jgi:hypothetical protein
MQAGRATHGVFFILLMKKVKQKAPLALTKSKCSLLYVQPCQGNRSKHVQVQEKSDFDYRSLPGYGLRVVAQE